MPIMEISIFPLGTRRPSVSTEVAAALKVLPQQSGIRAKIGAMGTVVEAKSLRTLLRIAERMHRAVLDRGVKRVVTTIKIDDRTDKPLSSSAKIRSAMRQLAPYPSP